MITGTATSLINLMGFITGVVLYVMLLWMVLTSRPSSNRLALLTGVLGFAWNAGAFGGYGMVKLGFTIPVCCFLRPRSVRYVFFQRWSFTPRCGRPRR
jgi:hypothetical protein